MDSTKSILSRLFQLTPIDFKDENDEKYERCCQLVLSLTNGLSEKEAHDALSNVVCKNAQGHDDVNIGLLIVILIEPTSGARFYRDLTYLTRDGLNLVINHLTLIILDKFNKLLDQCRSQIIWLIKEMIKNSVCNIDSLCFHLLRQIAGGDLSPRNMWLTEALLDIFIENRAWVEKFSVLVATIVYTYLRLIVDHLGPKYATLRQREVDFCTLLLRERFSECMIIGRDLVRLLLNVARIPEFEKLWRDIYSNPASFSPTFTGVAQLLAMRTSRRFLQCRLTPDMEKKIAFLTSQVKFGHQKRYQEWFQKQYLSTPESQTLRCDLIRFICGVIHPSNEVLCSDIIPRWAVIGWLLTTCTSNVAASSAKLSLFYDWLFFDPEKDSIMNIEPAILVIYHSVRSHPVITATLLDFLCRIMPNFSLSLKAQVKQGIYTSLRQILMKRVLPSLSPLFDSSKLDPELQVLLKETFPEFCSPSGIKVDEPLKDSSDLMVKTNHTSINNTEHEAQFSEDEDDIPLADKLRIRDMKFRPIRETKVDQIVITELIQQLNNNIRHHIISLQEEKDCELRCEIMERLLEAVLQEEFDQDVTSILGVCLAQILSDEFGRKIFPDEVDDESIEDSIGTPLFVMFRNLCQTPEDDPNRQPLLNILAEMSMHQCRLGYLLLYYLKASKSHENRMSSYKDYVNTLGSWAPVTRNSESKDLATSLLNDLKMCQEDDVRMFCYIIPDIYVQFTAIAVGNAKLLNLIVSCIDPTQLQDLICLLIQKNIIMFKKDSFLSVLNASLEWESFEQFCLWQLISAQNIPIEYILPMLPKLEFTAHSEALISIALLLKQEKPSADLLKHIMSREVKPNDNFAVTVLTYWAKEHEEVLAELVSSHILKSGSALKRKRQPSSKTLGPTVDQTLAHLDQLRITCKQNAFFNSDVIQSALLQVQASCSDTQKTKFSDLFALVEELDDMKSSKSRMGGRGKVSGPKNMKNKPAVLDSDTETDSTEDDEAIKPKPRKKKRTLLGFDSD
ncbi:integrator complex subunit 3 [Trichonephila inaurata madagascariensis]|uniref:SOSS complex subunit A homolog n=1 Tax=Trichonephila inaurata madagascariensis TaxID=2747483 RepID=A0A8X7CFK4_9ARAC|nr:integrator complex subunit 3 [Trichonephila inaurata madagascariensis]